VRSWRNHLLSTLSNSAIPPTPCFLSLLFGIVKLLGVVGRYVPALQRNILPPSSGLNFEALCFSETLVSTYKSTRPSYPERHRYFNRHENLKSNCLLFIFLTLPWRCPVMNMYGRCY
jgi:hypothetical protein